MIICEIFGNRNKYYKLLTHTPRQSRAEFNRLKKHNLSNQLFRSETSIGANISESQHAESKADFIHESKISPNKQKKQNIG